MNETKMYPIGEYGPFAEKAPVGEIVYGIFPVSVSGILTGKEVAKFTIRAKMDKGKCKATEKKFSDWTKANGVNAEDYKYFAIIA